MIKNNLNWFQSIILILLLVGCNKDDFSNPVNRKIETGSFIEITQVAVGTGGSTIAVNGGVLGGMTIEIPPGSYTTNKDFTISSADILNHTFGPDLNPITPLIRINNGGGYADSILTVTIPCVVPQGHFAMGFYYNEETGELEGIPVVAINDSNVILSTRHFSSEPLYHVNGNLSTRAGKFADILISSTEISSLFGNLESGFKPGVDDWEFINYGSYIEPGGHCAGQCITAMWYYATQKVKLNQAPLWNRFSTLQDPVTYDNRNGYRFASVVQKSIDWDNRDKAMTTFYDHPSGKRISKDSLTYLSFAYAIKLNKKPQYVSIRNDSGGHAMIVYQSNANTLIVADPNFPGSYDHKIELSNGKFKPYPSHPNANLPQEFYPRINYIGASAHISIEGVAELYKQVLNGTIGDAGKPDATFPAIQLVYWNESMGWVDIRDSLDVDLDSIEIACRCVSCKYPSGYYDQSAVIYFVNEKNQLLRSPGSKYPRSFAIYRNPGRTVVPFAIFGNSSTLGDSNARYIDFKSLIIHNKYKIKIHPDPIIGVTDRSLDITAELQGSYSQAKFIWNFGDNTPETTKYFDNKVQHAYKQAGEYTIQVRVMDDRTGQILGEATAPVQISNASSSFNFNWLQRKSNRDWFYDINFNLSGAVEGKNGNKVEQIVANENSKIVNVKFASIDSFLVNFTSSFSLSPLQITSTVDPKEIITYSGTPRLSWSTNNFIPPAGQATGNGTYGNSNCVGTITIKGYMDYTSTWYDDNIGEYKTTIGTNEWVLGYIQFEKY